MRERPDEMKATVPVAEGATLAALIAVTKAYSVTDGASMLGRMLRTARRPPKLAVLLSVLATIAVIAWRMEPGIQIAALALVASVFWFRRDALRDYYGKKKTATFLDTFSRRRAPRCSGDSRASATKSFFKAALPGRRPTA